VKSRIGCVQLQRVLDQSVCNLIARPDSQFLYSTRVYFYVCHILWPEVQSHSDAVMCM